MEKDRYHLINALQRVGKQDLHNKARQALQRYDDALDAQGDAYLAGSVKAWNYALACLAIELKVQQPAFFAAAELIVEALDEMQGEK